MIIKWSDIIAQKKENEFELGNVQDRIGHSDIHWTGKQVLRMYENGELNFDNALQRALVWDLERKSLFIHTIIKNYQIDPVKAVKVDGVYDILDGKQRLLGTLIAFMKGNLNLKVFRWLVFQLTETRRVWLILMILHTSSSRKRLNVM